MMRLSRSRNLFRRRPVLAAGALLAALAVAACEPVKPPPPELPNNEIDLADGFQPATQDVYFLDGAVLRNPDAETPDDAALFNVSGAPLDITWGEYAGVEAESVAVTERGDEPQTHFFIRLTGLVPNGVYSIFYTTLGPDSQNPLCSALRDMPVTTVVPTNPPDPSSFIADGSGAIDYVGNVVGTPMDATQLSLGVVYHADGATYHPLPNRRAFETQGENCVSSYGLDAMRQLWILQKWLF